MPYPFRNALGGICFALVLTSFPTPAEAQPPFGDSASPPGGFSAQEEGSKGTFIKGGTEIGLSLGGGVGVKIFGSSVYHDFALGSVYLGRIMSDAWCAGKWYEGNWELLAEVFGGYQTNHGGASLVGLTPFIRYNFIGRYPWVPFVEAGAGVSYTDVSRPDLGGDFQFNLQAGTEIEYFFRKDVAATLQIRYLHISNASIESPDHGVNAPVLLAGLTWFL